MSVLTATVPLVQRNYFLWLSLKMSFLHGFLWLKTSIRLRTRIRNAHLHVSVGRRWAAWWPHSGWRGDYGACDYWAVSHALEGRHFPECCVCHFLQLSQLHHEGILVLYQVVCRRLPKARASITSLNNCFKQPRGSITHSRLTGECVIIAQGNSARHLYKDSL